MKAPVPFNTGRVRVGERFEPVVRTLRHDGDAVRLQDALLARQCEPRSAVSWIVDLLRGLLR